MPTYLNHSINLRHLRCLSKAIRGTQSREPQVPPILKEILRKTPKRPKFHWTRQIGMELAILRIL